MKYSTTYLFIIAFLIYALPTSVFAQKGSCGAELPLDFESVRSQDPKGFQKELEKVRENLLRAPTSSGSCINYAPIKAHIIRTSAGTGGLSLADLNEAMDTMNVRYEAACMAFYLCGSVNYIDDDTYYDFDKSEEAALIAAHYEPDLINIYFANTVTSNGTSICGYAYYPGGNDISMMKNSCTTNGSTLGHEMGHFFGLPHTHSGGDELVNGSNCTTAGDDFCDTPADPQLSSSTVNSSCVYTGTETDANGDLYVPDPANIMSYSRKHCRVFFSDEQLATMSYNFLYVRNYWDCPDFDVDFSADVTESCDAPLTVNFTEEAVGETSYEWDFNNDGTIDDTNPNPTYTFTTAGTYEVRLTVSDGTNTIAKVKTAYIKVGSEAFPFSSDMENFTVNSNATGFEDNWTVSPAGTTSEYRWNTNDGGTPSSTTGPDVDHTLGTSSGIYAYSEATGASQGDIAELISPCLDVPAGASDASVRFWYHMYGSNMGTLHIDLHNGTNWINDFTAAIVGEQHSSGSDAWSEKTFSIAAYAGQSIQIRFRAERGNGYRSDMAVDDFELFTVSPLPVDLMSFTGQSNERGEHVLNWQTASEENSAFFLLEHSRNGVDFYPIEKVMAAGNTSITSIYSAINTIPSDPDNYYRLKMVDLDETFEYSSTVYLTYTRPGNDIAIYPNPSNGKFHLERQAVQNQWEIEIFNAVGQMVESIEWGSGNSLKTLNLESYAKGVYSVRIRYKGEVIRVDRLVRI